MPSSADFTGARRFRRHDRKAAATWIALVASCFAVPSWDRVIVRADLPELTFGQAASMVRDAAIRPLPAWPYGETRDHAELVVRRNVSVVPSDELSAWCDVCAPEFVPPACCDTECCAPQRLNLRDHDVEVGLNATIQFDTLHDFNALGLDPNRGVLKEFITADIPVGGPAARRTGRTGFSPNQTYFEVWAQTPTDFGQLKGLAKFNLAKLPVETVFQTYIAYGQWGWLKAGLDYTLWFNQAAAPDTLDFEGPNSIPYVRFAQVSLDIPLENIGTSPDYSLVIGWEDAPPDLTLPASVPSANTVNRLPTTIVKLVYQPDWARIELAGLYRRLNAQGVGYRSAVDGWGVSLSGSIDTWGKDKFIVAGVVGEALGAYSQDTIGLLLDAAPRSAVNPQLRAIPAAGTWVAYQHWWRPALRSSATLGYWHLDSQFDPTPNPTGTYHQALYSSCNLIWSPIQPIDMGLEYIYGHRTVTANTTVSGRSEGENHRLQATVRWNFGL